MIRIIVTAALIALFATPADARRHPTHQRLSYATEGQVVSHPEGCGRVAYCGCGVSVKVFGHPIRDLYLASNWSRFPRTQPASGMVAVRNHHVFYIESVIDNQTVMAWDPNSGGHQTRLHARSLAGFHVVNPHGGETQIASRHPHDHTPGHRRLKQGGFTQYADASFDRFRPQ